MWSFRRRSTSTKSFPGVFPSCSQESSCERVTESGVERGAGKAACQGGEGASAMVGMGGGRGGGG